MKDVGVVAALVLLVLVIWALCAQWGIIGVGGLILLSVAAFAELHILRSRGGVASPITDSDVEKASIALKAAMFLTAVSLIASIAAGIFAAWLSWGVFPTVGMIALLMIVLISP